MPMNRKRHRNNHVEQDVHRAALWAKRRDIPIAILAWLVLSGLLFWAASYVVQAILVVIVAVLLAFALTPAVKLLERWMPRIVSVIVVYFVVLSGLSLLLYEVVGATVGQLFALARNLQGLLLPQGQPQLAPIIQFFNRFGITTSQLEKLGRLLEQQAAGFTNGVLPLISGIADFILNVIIVAVLSIYLVFDGSRAVEWLRRNTPIMQRRHTHFFLDTLERVIGGYIRGQLIMSSTVGLLVGVGMAAFGVPYAVLLGVVAFILEFVPIIGTIISGILCVLIALSKGLLIAVLVLVYFIVVHVIEGDILSPRVVGKAVGVHPAVSLFALLAGAELFGIWGAVLGSPLAGLIQAVLVAVWQDWRASHPEQFPEDDGYAEGDMEENGDNGNSVHVTENAGGEHE